MEKRIFEENQKHTRWEITLLISLLSIGLTYRFIEQNFISPVENGISLSAFLLLMMILVGTFGYFASMRLSVKVTDEFISFRYHPFQEKRHKIKWSDVAGYEIVQLSEVAQWNGWNVNFSQEKVFSVSGRNGISIQTKNGESFFVGSKDVEGLRKAMDKVYP